MKLRDLPGKLSELLDNWVVFAEEPWTPDSELVLRELGSDGKIPDEVKNSRFRYFLEMSAIDEFIDGLKADGLTEPEQLSVIIYYAKNDAFPAWRFEQPDDLV